MRSIYRGVAGRDAILRWCSNELDGWSLRHDRSVVSAGGVGTHLVSAGDGSKTVLVLPGTNFNAATGLPMARALAARGRVVLVDRPGQPGLSSEYRPPKRGRLGWYGRWLSGLLDELTEPVTVLGWSMGAAVAVACTSPRIDRRILVSPGGLTRLRTPPAVLAAGACWAIRRGEADSVRLLRVMHGPGFVPRPALVEWMTLVTRHVRSTTDPGLTPIAGAGGEYVAIGGEQDVFLPPRRLRPVLKQALGIELVTVPGAGHLLAEEYPAEVAGLALPG